MKNSFLYLPISMHGFTISLILDISATQSFISCKLAKQLSAILQDVELLTIVLPMGRAFVSTKAK